MLTRACWDLTALGPDLVVFEADNLILCIDLNHANWEASSWEQGAATVKSACV